MQLNRNGIPVQTQTKREIRKKRFEMDFRLPMKRFKLVSDEADVEVVVPQFSPILEALRNDG